MKKVTKKEISLIESLKKLNITDQQLNGVIKLYHRHKDDQASIDQGHRFKEINEGKRVRDCMMVCSIPERKNRGVYKIKFDSNKFYIGRSKLISERIKHYAYDFRQFFKTNEYHPEHYLRKVFEYLKEDPMAYFFTVELLEECFTVEELQKKEQKWLNKYKDNPNCLNVGFVARKPTNELPESLAEQKLRLSNTGIAKRGGRYIFYPKKKIESSVLDRRLESVSKSTPDRKAKATDFSFGVPEINSELGHTVFKMFYGERYIIHKGKTLAGSIFLLQKGCGYFLAYDHSKESKFDKDYYNSFYDFVRRNPGKEFKVEVLFTSEDAYEILCREQIELNKAIRDKKCLNQNLQGYIPTLNSKTNMHGWVTPEQVSRFYEFLAQL